MLNTEAGITYTQHNQEWNFGLARQKADYDRAIKRLKQGIWVYFLLLIFEGGLRKWALPALANPILIIRDPVAIWLIIYSYMHGTMKTNIYVTIAMLVGTLSMLTTMIIGHGNMSIALFGLRIFFIHFPLIFIIGRTFTYKDVEAIGRAMIWIAPFMLILIVTQFYSPQTAFVNKGVGGVGGAGFSGVGEYFRPPGTFSFISGLASYFGFTSAFVCYFWLNNAKNINRTLLIVATVCVIASIPFSISRTLFFQVILSFIFTTIIASKKPGLMKKIAGAVLALAVAILALSSAGFIKTGTQAFTERFETANKVEGGTQGVLLDRFLGGLVRGITESGDLPFFGYGLGLGTNVGAKLLTGNAVFLFESEGEWGRLIGEMGIILGLIFIFIRLKIAVNLMTQSYRKIIIGNYLPWLIISFSFLNILQGQWGQPTSLGFSVFSAGLVYASLAKPKYQRK